ncbi:hypothetical protein KCP73_15750 [Salmonella enterica subsp. enterica]|nr:hypothetical protein KCP73_15750 [Salmonella enterica subsp. enterica]
MRADARAAGGSAGAVTAVCDDFNLVANRVSGVAQSDDFTGMATRFNIFTATRATAFANIRKGAVTRFSRRSPGWRCSPPLPFTFTASPAGTLRHSGGDFHI